MADDVTPGGGDSETTKAEASTSSADDRTAAESARCACGPSAACEPRDAVGQLVIPVPAGEPLCVGEEPAPGALRVVDG